jgi:OmpA-OmpF porin, OOP family
MEKFMKYLLSLLTVLTISINADEFPFIEPVAVERASQATSTQAIILADSDNDGIADKNDTCPNTQVGVSVDANGCEVKNDSDNDGVADENDQCSETPNGVSVDYLGCELDSDQDGVVDSDDQCPDTSKDFSVDGYGCPQTTTLNLTFPPSKANISDKLINELQTFALFLKENKGYQVVIYGYTDSLGDKKQNKILSQKRANTVKEALRRYGISITRLTAIGKGEEDPVADNSTKEGRAMNRRIEVELLK